jgi:hypothetical protein
MSAECSPWRQPIPDSDSKTENPAQVEHKLGLRLKRDTGAFFGEWRRRAAWQADCRRVLGGAVARLMNKTLALAVQRWRERAQWQVGSCIHTHTILLYVTQYSICPCTEAAGADQTISSSSLTTDADVLFFPSPDP